MSSEAHSNGTSAVAVAAADAMEAEAQRLSELQKRREKLAAWKAAKQSAKGGDGADSGVPTTTTTNGSDAAMETDAEGGSGREAHDELDDAAEKRRRVAIGDDALEAVPDDAGSIVRGDSLPLLTDDAAFKPMRKRDDDNDDDASDASFTFKRNGGPTAERQVELKPAQQQQPQQPPPQQEDIDPLDAFMMGVHQEVRAIASTSRANEATGMRKSSSKGDILVDNAGLAEDGRDDAGSSDDEFGFVPSGQEDETAEKEGGKSLAPIDHSKIDYEPFQKNLYVEAPEIKAMSDEDVAAFRLGELENTTVRGDKHKGAVPCPRPVMKFAQCGLAKKLFDKLAALNFETPTPIQAQAIPALMSGRDVIGIAATGSGKTLAFLLPLFRHLMAQRPLASGEGPIGLILCPTRELCVQTAEQAKLFKKELGVRTVPIYGGAPLQTQIAQLKRGAEIVVATPGRMIDVLCLNGGRVTNLTRVTFVVLDEADRMFDMGFQPQIERILRNVRPDHQTAMFTATFPRTIESVARKFLRTPVEITVGGRTRVPPHIEQRVEVLNDAQRFARLLQLVAAQAKTKSASTLVFVQRKETADQLKTRLTLSSVNCQALHAAVPQEERDFIIDDFKLKQVPVLVATSIAARGLDVEHLGLVINYDTPKHLEDYVQRCGRTGRAGRKGVAVTFITPENACYAPEVVKALKDSKVAPPAELLSLAQSYLERCAAGEAVLMVGGGYGGSGYSFTAAEKARQRKERKSARKAAGEDVSDDDDDVEVDEDGNPVAKAAAAAAADAAAAAGNDTRTDQERKEQQAQEEVAAALREMKAMELAHKKAEELKSAAPTLPATAAAAAVPAPTLVQAPTDSVAAVRAAALAKLKSAGISTMPAMSSVPMPTAVLPPLPGANNAMAGGGGGGGAALSAAERAKQMALQFAATLNKKKHEEDMRRVAMTSTGPAAVEFDINDVIQQARWRVTNREAIDLVCDRFNVGITARGQHIPATRQAAPGERRLHLLIEGQSRQSVEAAKAELQRIIDEALTTNSGRPEGGGGGRNYNKYNV
jgi:ATP-dependent RNA helicase DDX46/PRP5